MNKLFLSKFILALLDFITFNASFSLSLLIIMDMINIYLFTKWMIDITFIRF